MVPQFEKREVRIGELERVADELMATFQESRIFAFYGHMGSGKTTFIRAICKTLQSDDTVTSPTFAIVNEYRTATGKSLFHFDFYRLKKLEEAYDLGYEDYFYGGDYCLIEWPEKVESLLPPSYVEVKISEDGDQTRTIEASLVG
jgi:tRNA threonylcarbamoyladenosine biosynthesis protein TsaE